MVQCGLQLCVAVLDLCHRLWAVVVGVQDPHIASAKNNLAEFYRNTGRWKQAEELYKEVRTHTRARAPHAMPGPGVHRQAISMRACWRRCLRISTL